MGVRSEVDGFTEFVVARSGFRVTMRDTDAAQVIYFAAPADWTERVLTGWLADAGLPLSESLAAGFGDPVVRAEMAFHAPLRLDDRVHATLSVCGRSSRSLTFRCAFTRADGVPDGDEEPAVEVWLTKVYVRLGPDGLEPAPLTDELNEVLDVAAARG